MPGCRIFLCLVCALVLLAGLPARALEVQQELWGFDGRVVPGRFNPVSLLMANRSGAAFDGVLTFAPTLGFGGPRGAAYVQPVFIGPQSARWVQFEVFFAMGSEAFSLSWGRGAKERLDFDRERPTGPPACVWLMDETNAFARPTAFKAFPDQLFPTTVAATDGLDAVILDYAPRWEPARREAFLDWLRRGGIVHLLPSVNGEFPVFADTLAPLNGGGETVRVGAGRVVRHRVPREELRPETLAASGFPARELKPPDNPAVHNLEETFYQRLSSLTRPNVSWWLLNSLTFFYIALIGPVAYRTARRMDFRWAIAAFLGMVALFGLAFAIVGRRGYGESQTVHSLSIARSLGGARWDVTQWLSAFATSSSQYELTHAAPANLYATSTSGDSAAGQVLNGKDGKFFADIPLYSSRAFTHRGVMQGDDLGVTVEKWEVKANELQPAIPARLTLILKTGPAFPSGALDVSVRYRDHIYPLSKNGNSYVAFDYSGVPIGDLFNREKLQPLTYGFNYSGNNNSTPADRLREAIPLLQARALGVSAITPHLPERTPPADRLQLLIAAPAPPGFHMQGKGFAHENGVVLYVQDLFQP